MPSVKEILEMPWSEVRKSGRSGLAQLTSTLASAANKRIRRLEAASGQSNIVDDFSVKGKSFNELQSEFARAKRFLNNKTMSLSGQAELRRHSKQKLEEKLKGEGNTKEDRERRKSLKQKMDALFDDKSNYDTFWKTFDKLVERYPVYGTKQFKYELIEKMVDIMSQPDTDFDIDSLFERMQREIDESYEDSAYFDDAMDIDDGEYDVI